MNALSDISFDALLHYEAIIRMTIFVVILVLMLALEYLLPKRARKYRRGHRWPANLLLIAVDTLALRLIIPIASLAFASYIVANGWGLFNTVTLPIWFEIVLSIILLDMLIYWQHVASHKFPIFWSFHKIHHGDRDLDVTTGIRFHPLEIILSMLYKFLCIFVLGPAAIAVFIFEITLNACALFNHSNIRIPTVLDKYLRLLIVTPDMHRVHHSILERETNSNYGFSLSIWDRVFKTYIAQPENGHNDMAIGLSEYQTDEPNHLRWCLFTPFKK